MTEHPDYTKVIHVRENSSGNESHLNANRQKFTGQAAIILSLFQKGIKLTSRSAMLQYGIGHLARRIKDLRDNGKIHIDEEWEVDKDGKTTRNKVWFILRKTETQNLYKPGTKTAADYAKDLIHATQGKLL
jgi:hypothetical protein